MASEVTSEKKDSPGRSGNILLIGFMGSGKTSVGGELARIMQKAFVDTDERIEQRMQRTISEIFSEEGEAAFRDYETQELRRLLKEEPGMILSVGGGMPVRKENRELMRQLGTVVYLQAQTDTLLERLQGDDTRPLLQGVDLRERILQLTAQREDCYRQTAHVCLPTDELTIEEAAREIERIIK